MLCVIACQDISKIPCQYYILNLSLVDRGTRWKISLYMKIGEEIVNSLYQNLGPVDGVNCKRTLQSSLGNLVWVSIIQLALRSLEPAIHKFLFLLFSLPWLVLHSLIRYSSYQCPNLCSLSNWHTDRLVQYKQLVMYGRIPYLNIDQSSWAIHCSYLSSPLPLMLSVIRGCL